MHYVDEGAGDPVLLLHGEPTWAYLYRKMIPTLAGAARVVAPDYFGFGRSDKPMRIEDYSYDFHFASIARLADELDLRETMVVVQDWGGPIGLRLAVERPDRVSRLVILNTGIGAGRAPSEEWLRFREFVRRVGTDLVPGQLIRISTVGELDDEVVEAYNAPFPTPESKAGVLAFPELVPTEIDHPGAAKMLEVRAALETLGAAGARPLLRLRPDLLARRRRTHGLTHPRRRPGRDRRGRRPLPPGGERRGDRGADRALSQRDAGDSLTSPLESASSHSVLRSKPRVAYQTDHATSAIVNGTPVAIWTAAKAPMLPLVRTNMRIPLRASR